MKPKLLVKLSNSIGLAAIILLVYWVFIFITTEVFGLKVFRENLSETFYMSILGILALMAGALMINIMFNLTRIADKQNVDDTYKPIKVKRIGLLFILSFPLILTILIGGDYLTSRKKEKMLVQSAESIISDYRAKVDSLADYTYSLEWIKNADNTLDFLSKTDESFPNISVIIKDNVNNSDVYLEYSNSAIYISNDTIIPKKQSFILRTTKEERDYLSDIFNSKRQEYHFSSHGGNYELYYPYIKDGKVIVFYFSDYQRYGKLGS